jgi:transcriptional antiterminator NusG
MAEQPEEQRQRQVDPTEAEAPVGSQDEAAGEAAPQEPSSEPARGAGAETNASGLRDDMQWYVLRVASNKEEQVRQTLERKVKIEGLEERIGRILVPTLKERRMRGGQVRVYERKLYPGYVFVEMKTDEDGSIPEHIWFLVKETTGVGDFIGSDGKPVPMGQVDAEKMLAAAEEPEAQAGLAGLAYKKGDPVKVREGPFENFEGVVDEINQQKGVVRVIVTIFGRPTPIELEYLQIEPA